MKKKLLGGSVLGAGLGLAALISFSSLASADSSTPPSAPKVTVACGADAAPPKGAAVHQEVAKAGKGAVSAVEATADGGPAGKAPAGHKGVTSTAELKDGKLFIDGKEQAMPADCGEGKPMTISVADAPKK